MLAAQVRRLDGAVALETGELTLRVELDILRFEVRSADGALHLGSCRPRVRLGDRLIPARRAELEEVVERDAAGGSRTTLRLAATGDADVELGDADVELGLELEVSEDPPGLVVRMALRNGGSTPLAVDAFELECAGPISLPGAPADLRFYRMGYQSWSPAGRLPLRGRDARPRPGVIGRMHFGPFTPRAARGRHVSDFVTHVGVDGERGLTLGFLTHRESLTHVTALHRGGRLESLVAACAGERVPVAPGESYRAEHVWIGLDRAGEDGIATWADATGRAMGAPVPAHVESGWCSWYHYFTRVAASDIEGNLARLADYKGLLDVVQIDDGFQSRVGDWLEPDASFPGGVAPLAREIRDSGFRAGLWLAPFLASRTSKLAENHPDWLLRDARGRPVYALAHSKWDGRWIHALDPTHPEVISWLADLVRSVQRMGFDYLKLDFLYAGTLAGVRHDASARSADAYRRGLASIRGAVADGGFVLGCGAPLGPSVGLVDGMRIGPDVAPRWSSTWTDLVLGVPAAPAAANSIRNTLARSALHQRLWLNDPDCVLVRDAETRLADAEAEAVAGAVAISGGLMVASDDLACVGPERQNLLARLTPALQTTPRVSSWTGEVPDEVFQHFEDGAVLVYRVNLGSRPLARAIDPARLGLSGPVHAYDVLGDEALGVYRDPFELEPLAPRSAFLLRLTPADGSDRVVGSTLHVSGGSAETRSLERVAADRARLTLARTGHASGRVLVSPAGEMPVPVHVDFEGEIELDVPGQGVVPSPDLAD